MYVCKYLLIHRLNHQLNLIPHSTHRRPPRKRSRRRCTRLGMKPKSRRRMKPRCSTSAVQSPSQSWTRSVCLVPLPPNPPSLCCVCVSRPSIPASCSYTKTVKALQVQRPPPPPAVMMQRQCREACAGGCGRFYEAGAEVSRKMLNTHIHVSVLVSVGAYHHVMMTQLYFSL